MPFNRHDLLDMAASSPPVRRISGEDMAHLFPADGSINHDALGTILRDGNVTARDRDRIEAEVLRRLDDGAAPFVGVVADARESSSSTARPLELRADQVERLAREENCTVYIGAPDELLLDLDTPWTPGAGAQFRAAYTMACERDLPLGNYEVLASRNGNTHVIVHLTRAVDMTERLLMQALLGSDLRREMLNYARHLQGIEPNNLLFRPGPPEEDIEPFLPGDGDDDPGPVGAPHATRQATPAIDDWSF